jgi:hypothetical protein
MASILRSAAFLRNGFRAAGFDHRLQLRIHVLLTPGFFGRGETVSRRRTGKNQRLAVYFSS